MLCVVRRQPQRPKAQGYADTKTLKLATFCWSHESLRPGRGHLGPDLAWLYRVSKVETGSRQDPVVPMIWYAQYWVKASVLAAPRVFRLPDTQPVS